MGNILSLIAAAVLAAGTTYGVAKSVSDTSQHSTPVQSSTVVPYGE